MEPLLKGVRVDLLLIALSTLNAGCLLDANVTTSTAGDEEFESITDFISANADSRHYLKSSDLKACEKKRGFRIPHTLSEILTGQIDLLQLRNGFLNIKAH
jgi:hypothetical protein